MATSSGPRIIASSDDFRLVRKADDTYALELPDGADALGVEKWRDVTVSRGPMKALVDYLIREAVKGERHE